MLFWVTSQGWGLISQFSPFLFFPFFPNDQNSGNLYKIKFIFGRCHRSWAAETPGKCEHDWNYLNYTFAKSKFPVTEKLANGALVTPTPGLESIASFSLPFQPKRHKDYYTLLKGSSKIPPECILTSTNVPLCSRIYRALLAYNIMWFKFKSIVIYYDI